MIIKEHNLNGEKYCKHSFEDLLWDQTQYKETSASATYSTVDILTWHSWEALEKKFAC